MKNLLKLIFVCLGLILATCQSYGQIRIKLADKNYTIAKFVSTSVRYPYAPPVLQRAKILQPITESVNEVEIRINYGFTTLVLQGDAGKFTVTDIHYFFLRIYKDTLKFKSLKTFNDGNTPYRYSEKTINAPDTLFSSLIKDHLFDFDEKAIRDSLAIAKVKVTDREVYDGYVIIVEVKVKDKYRLLRLDPIRYPVDIKELQAIGLLSNTFDDLLKLTN